MMMIMVAKIPYDSNGMMMLKMFGTIADAVVKDEVEIAFTTLRKV